MAAKTLQVNCINKSDRQNPHERIRNIGGIDGGIRWKKTETQAIAEIEADVTQFFVHAAGRTVMVIVATHLGRKYLKTQADGIQPDNLLALPECP
jgi:hypothetical protein